MQNEIPSNLTVQRELTLLRFETYVKPYTSKPGALRSRLCKRFETYVKRNTSKPLSAEEVQVPQFETYAKSSTFKICILVPCATLCHMNPFLLLKELFFMLYPYAISRESVNGHRVWIAKSLHLKGCVAQGDTRLEAIKELESNEIAWLETARMLHIPQSN